LSARLRRLTPALAAAAVGVELGRARDASRRRIITIGGIGTIAPGGDWTVDAATGRYAGATVQQKNPGNSAVLDGLDGLDGRLRAISGGDGFRGFSLDDDGEPPADDVDYIEI
jgi:hypothetical protein